MEGVTKLLRHRPSGVLQTGSTQQIIARSGNDQTSARCIDHRFSASKGAGQLLQVLSTSLIVAATLAGLHMLASSWNYYQPVG
eukprot:3261650-Amphidinium_carterae.1